MSDAGYYEHEWAEDRPLDPEVYRLRLEGTAALAAPTVATARSDRWLDVGSGDGRFLRDLASALGVDAEHVVAAERSGSAASHITVPALRASSDALPFADAQFGLVSALEVIEHLPVDVYDATRHELARVTGRHALITVPNQERTARANVRCPSCGCQFNPSRHLRSFRPDAMADLLPGLRLVRVAEFGHRAYWYPRVVRRALETAGLLHRPGVPVCPQCGYSWGTSTAVPDRPAPADAPAPARPGLAQRGYRLARTFAPRARHPYVLGALYERR